MNQPILQFGSSRFLQAHVDLFVSQAMACGQALGGIAVVQTTASAASSRRIAALAATSSYPVQIRGLANGLEVDQHLTGQAIRAALQADRDWPQVRDAVCTEVQLIVSNTGDQGYLLDPADGPELLDSIRRVPRSFPAKLLVLLHARWCLLPAAPLSLYPCELVSRNGDTLREVVATLAAQWSMPAAFMLYLREHCVWVNSLVDRIVSAELEPVGAIAEPYALWAIERQARMILPCTHPAIVLTDTLQDFERLKLWLLNLGHTYLAERWLAGLLHPQATVREAMQDTLLRVELESVWNDEVLPVFDIFGQRAAALDYLVELRDRLLNPFLAHRLADIAQHHAQKKQRRITPLLELARQHGLQIAQPRLHAALASSLSA